MLHKDREEMEMLEQLGYMYRLQEKHLNAIEMFK